MGKFVTTKKSSCSTCKHSENISDAKEQKFVCHNRDNKTKRGYGGIVQHENVKVCGLYKKA